MNPKRQKVVTDTSEPFFRARVARSGRRGHGLPGMGLWWLALWSSRRWFRWRTRGKPRIRGAPEPPRGHGAATIQQAGP